MNEAEQIEKDEAELRELGLEPAAPEAVESTESTETDESEESKDDTTVEPKEDESKDDESKDDESKNDETEPKHVSSKDETDAIKALKAGFKDEIRVLTEKLDAATKPKDEVISVKSIEERAKALAEKLEFDPEKTKALLEEMKEFALSEVGDKAKLTDDERKLLADLKEEKEVREQEAIFNDEWNALLPKIKEQFPNATDEQIAKAKEKLDELSHTEKYNTVELDYIMFKEKGELDKVLFSPKQKTFESGKNNRADETDNEFVYKSAEEVAAMSPAAFEKYEKAMEAANSAEPREKLRMTTRNDRTGQVEERLV